MSIYRRIALLAGPFVLSARETVVEAFAIPYIALDLTALAVIGIASLTAGFFLMKQANAIALQLLLFVFLAALSALLTTAFYFVLEHVKGNYTDVWSFAQSIAFSRGADALAYFNLTAPNH